MVAAGKRLHIYWVTDNKGIPGYEIDDEIEKGPFTWVPNYYKKYVIR